MINSRTTGVSAMTLGLAVCGGVSLLGGCGSTTTASLPDEGVRTIASGSFEGFAGHAVSGETFLTESYGDIYLVLDENFALENGEKARLGFGRDGQFYTTTRFTTLKDASGRQVYYVPASINPYEFNSVYVWGNKSRQVLGFASLERAPETLTGMHAAPAAEPAQASAETEPTEQASTTQEATATDETTASVQTED